MTNNTKAAIALQRIRLLRKIIDSKINTRISRHHRNSSIDDLKGGVIEDVNRIVSVLADQISRAVGLPSNWPKSTSAFWSRYREKTMPCSAKHKPKPAKKTGKNGMGRGRGPKKTSKPSKKGY